MTFRRLPSYSCDGSRFAIAVRGRSVFTRSQQARIFKEAYKHLAVHASTLRNLGNFKGLFMEGSNRLRVNVIKGITRFGAFRIEKHEGKACIRFKATMHSQHWGGITDTGSLHADAPPHAMFTGAVPSFTDIPRFTLTTVPPEVIHHIKRRLLSTRPRLEASCALGENNIVKRHIHSRVVLFIWCE